MAVCRKRPPDLVHLLLFYARNQKVYQIRGSFYKTVYLGIVLFSTWSYTNSIITSSSGGKLYHHGNRRRLYSIIPLSFSSSHPPLLLSSSYPLPFLFFSFNYHHRTDGAPHLHRRRRVLRAAAAAVRIQEEIPRDPTCFPPSLLFVCLLRRHANPIDWFTVSVPHLTFGVEFKKRNPSTPLVFRHPSYLCAFYDGTQTASSDLPSRLILARRETSWYELFSAILVICVLITTAYKSNRLVYRLDR